MLIVKKNYFKKLVFGSKHRSLGLSFGKRISRFRGGGVKRLYKLIDIYRLVWNVHGYIIRHEYSTKGLLNLISYENGILTYSPHLLNSKIGHKVITSSQLLYPLKNGDSSFLFNFKYGQLVSNIELNLFQGSAVCRSSGTFGKVIRHLNSFSLVRLPSGMEYWFSSNCIAILGVNSINFSNFLKYKKAGLIRRLGWRPRVRGVAMNPVDHPHGGGEGKTSGGRISVSKWGWLTKNIKKNG